MFPTHESTCILSDFFSFGFIMKLSCMPIQNSVVMYNLCISADGGFSNWGVFTPCSATCGGGMQSRSRVCNNPPPQYNGKDCVGPVNETRACNTFYCPSKFELHLYLFN